MVDQSLHYSERQPEFRGFALEHVVPYADQHDKLQKVSPDLIAQLARRGYLAPFLPERWGGQTMNMVVLGILHEEIGRGCSSVRSLLTVHSMVAHTILRWGSDAQRERWLSSLSRGSVVGALAVSEPNAGSDVNGIETTATADRDGFLLNGQKRWITFGQIAGVFIVLAKLDGRPTAFIVERDSAGLTAEPIRDLLGTRGSMLALLTFDNCFVPRTNLVGKPGFGASPIVLSALGLGRYSVACGSLGIAQACLDASYEYASRTIRFGVPLSKHQLVQQMITEMITELAASRLLCRLAGTMKDQKDPQEINQSFVAKYYASTTAMRAALNAVQIHGANGCTPAYAVERLMRDAKIMEIIEGSTQIQQITIATLGFQQFEQERRMSAACA